jgi:serine protease
VRGTSSVLAFGAILAVAACSAGSAPNLGGASTRALPAPSALAEAAEAAGSALGSAAASTPVSATAPGPVAAPRIPRGPSTRTAPRVLARSVAAGRSARVATVRVVDGRARVEVVGVVGPFEAERRIAAAQADPDVVAVEVDRRVTASGSATGPSPTGYPIATDPPPLSTAVNTQTSSGTDSSPASPTPAATVQAPSNDPYRSEQWALDALGAERLWTVSRGTGQVVAVVDSGVDGTHPDLVGQVLGGIDYVAGAGTGWTDPYGHGTHVAGIVAAVANNGIGVAGLAPDARILPVRVLDSDGAGWDSDIAAGLIWAADHGATVINCSLGGPDAADPVRYAVSYAIGRGAVVVAAAGNERADGNPVSYPAAFALPGELGVAATTAARVSANYSDTGSYISLAAPGDGILSTLDGSYYRLSGTSMAAPYVSAAVALVRAVAPSLGPIDVAQLLTSTADDLEVVGRDDATGSGLIDPAAALCARQLCPPTAPQASPSPSPSPSQSPSSAALPMKITVRAATARVVAGRTAVLSLTITDADGPVPGATARLTGPGTTVVARADEFGMLTLRTSALRTGPWVAAVTAEGHAGVSTRWSLTVVPAVVVGRVGNRAIVTVSPARGQSVTVRRGNVVLSRGKLPRASSGTVRLKASVGGAVQVVVGAGDGLVGVVVTARP